MELRWEYVLGIVIIVVAGAGLIVDRVDSESFIAVISVVIAFVTGRYAINVLSMQLATQKHK